jgi:hypothetical protein
MTTKAGYSYDLNQLTVLKLAFYIDQERACHLAKCGKPPGKKPNLVVVATPSPARVSQARFCAPSIPSPG